VRPALRTFFSLTLSSPAASTGQPHRPDPHQVQPGGVHQVPGAHRGVAAVHRRRAAGLQRRLLPPPPLAPQAQGEAHRPGRRRRRRRRHRHLSGRTPLLGGEDGWSLGFFLGPVARKLKVPIVTFLRGTRVVEFFPTFLSEIKSFEAQVVCQKLPVTRKKQK